MAISLKKYSLHELERTIATALSNLCEEPVKVTISSLVDKKFRPNWQVSIEAEISKIDIPDETVPF